MHHRVPAAACDNAAPKPERLVRPRTPPHHLRVLLLCSGRRRRRRRRWPLADVDELCILVRVEGGPDSNF